VPIRLIAKDDETQVKKGGNTKRTGQSESLQNSTALRQLRNTGKNCRQKP
jgi:hypothetical protein